MAEDLKNGSLIALPMTRHVSRTYSYLLRFDKVIDGPLSDFVKLFDRYKSSFDGERKSRDPRE